MEVETSFYSGTYAYDPFGQHHLKTEQEETFDNFDFLEDSTGSSSSSLNSPRSDNLSLSTSSPSSSAPSSPSDFPFLGGYDNNPGELNDSSNSFSFLLQTSNEFSNQIPNELPTELSNEFPLDEFSVEQSSQLLTDDMIFEGNETDNTVSQFENLINNLSIPQSCSNQTQVVDILEIEEIKKGIKFQQQCQQDNSFLSSSNNSSNNFQMDEWDDQKFTPENSPPLGDDLNVPKVHQFRLSQGITLDLKEEELINLEIDDIAKLAGTKLNKNEEKDLKRLRRKVRNKASAAQSRQKKKDYVVGLEERVENVVSFNLKLKKRLEELEKENSSLKGHVTFLASQVDDPSLQQLSKDLLTSCSSSSTLHSLQDLSVQKDNEDLNNSLLTQSHLNSKKGKKTKASGIYLMLIILSFGIFYNMTQHFPLPGFESTSKSGEDVYTPVGTSERHLVRKVLEVDDLLMMDTVPMIRHCKKKNLTPLPNDQSFWNAYAGVDLQSLQNDDMSEDEEEDENECDDQEHVSGHFSPSYVNSKVIEGLKTELENYEQENIKNIVCSGEMCLVRVDDI